MTTPAILVLADGNVFQGVSVGVTGCTVGEVVFNTAMSGYQEILTDPSYCQQLITFTYPHIGNTGINSEDNESSQIWASGLILREVPSQPSSWRQEESLQQFLFKQKIVGIAEVDTRRLTRILRDKGAQGACIMSGSIDEKEALKLAGEFSGLEGVDLAKTVTSRKIYSWNEGSWSQEFGYQRRAEKDLLLHVVVYDFGVKQTILRLLVDRGCRLTVVPATTPAEEVLALNPDGVFLSNGPGDPAACGYAIEAIKCLLTENIPLFGICLGMQLLALAHDAKTIKMKFGHHGANHPVEDLATKQVFITSQNHGFCVDEVALPNHLTVTHRSLFDHSIQGIVNADNSAFGFQGHPEASPGPHDIVLLFDQFIESMRLPSSANSNVLTRDEVALS